MNKFFKETTLVSSPDHPKARLGITLAFSTLTSYVSHVIANSLDVPLVGSNLGTACILESSTRKGTLHRGGRKGKGRYTPSSFHNSSTAFYSCYYLHTYVHCVLWHLHSIAGGIYSPTNNVKSINPFLLLSKASCQA